MNIAQEDKDLQQVLLSYLMDFLDGLFYACYKTKP